MTEQVEIVSSVRALLGEGPSWDAECQRLLWVDIDGRLVHLFDPATGDDATIARARPVSAAIPADDGRILLCEQGRLGLLDPASGGLEVVAELEPNVATNRTNDAKCDPDGRLWVGTMDVDVAPGCGALYRLDAGGPTPVIERTSCSNGIGWSPDASVLYSRRSTSAAG